MSEPSTATIEQALRSGKSAHALAEARRYCEEKGATRETGIEIAKVAAAVYRDLIAAPVHDFAEAAPTTLPPEVGPLVNKALMRLIAMTTDWEKKLWDLHTERLVREVREWVRGRHLDAAAANVGRLMALAPAEQRARRAGYIGNVLATVVNNQREAQQLTAMLAKTPGQYQLDGNLVRTMEEARAKRAGEMASFNMDNLEREFSSQLTSLSLDIKNALPDSGQMGEPDEIILRDAGDLFRAILRVPIFRQEADLFLDATALLVEFVPREQTQTAKLARLEGRTYGTLGFTAKKAVQLVFMDIGRNKFFCSLYKEWAKTYAQTESARSIVELMGALRSTEFNDFLKALKSDKAVGGAVAAQLNQALGTVAGAEAADELMSSLRDVLGKKRIEASELREAEQILTNLGSIVKSPRTEESDRARILDFARTHIPEDLTRLVCTASLQLFTTKVDQQTSQQTHFAIRALSRGLWMADNTTAHQKGGERQANEFGFRGEIVQALIKIGPRDPHSLARAIEPLAARYGAAFMAAAEVFEKVKSDEFLPVLERMLNQTLLHDENASNAYQQEFFWDAASQQRKPVTKDKILGPLVYTIGTIGGDQSKAILKRYQEAISIGRVPPPSGEVAGYMEKFLGADAFAGSQAAEAEDAQVDEAEIKPLLKALTGWYLLAGKDKKRIAKIQALTKLERLAAPETVEPIINALTDSDPMVVSAAISCLTAFALPTSGKMVRTLAVDGALKALEHKDPAMRQAALKLIKEIGPNRKDVRDKVMLFVKQCDRREIRDALAQALKAGGGGQRTSSDTAAGAATGTGENLGGSNTAAADAMNKLAVKQQYLAARKAWINSGKKGDPPSKPEGMD